MVPRLPQAVSPPPVRSGGTIINPPASRPGHDDPHRHQGRQIGLGDPALDFLIAPPRKSVSAASADGRDRARDR
ncbi:MAG: hypothetical protein NTW87_01290 [Planctomycetota bacterium]|nr:hypothetical protein [Planctomycetota bacterium]